MYSPMPLGPEGAMLLVESSLLQRLENFRQINITTPEAGGILMGYRRGMHTHVTEATFPASEDVQSRFGFVRRAAHHKHIAVRRWKDTGETLDYVGEWHTHPEDDPAPSDIDIHHWMKITRSSTRPMVFVIIGRKRNWCGVGWERGIRCVGKGFS